MPNPATNLDDRRTARDLAAVLQCMSEAIRNGNVPPWLVVNIAPSIAMCHEVIHDFMAKKAGARPLPPAVRSLDDALAEMRSHVAAQAAPRLERWAAALMVTTAAVLGGIACGALWWAVH